VETGGTGDHHARRFRTRVFRSPARSGKSNRFPPSGVLLTALTAGERGCSRTVVAFAAALARLRPDAGDSGRALQRWPRDTASHPTPRPPKVSPYRAFRAFRCVSPHRPTDGARSGLLRFRLRRFSHPVGAVPGSGLSTPSGAYRHASAPVHGPGACASALSQHRPSAVLSQSRLLPGFGDTGDSSSLLSRRAVYRFPHARPRPERTRAPTPGALHTARTRTGVIGSARAGGRPARRRSGRYPFRV
jgi:hypothetical protein